MTGKPECFVIAPIGSENSEIRIRSDRILKHVIRPVAEECGYRAVRADEISEPGSISTQVINRILEVPMVVADLTGNNANVFYELAIRHAIRKPYVQIIQKGERIPFDVSGIRTVEIDHTDLDSVASAMEGIKKQMEFTTANPQKIDSPISAAIDLASLTQSDDPLKRQLGEVMNALAEIKNILESRLPNTEWQHLFPTRILAANDIIAHLGGNPGKPITVADLMRNVGSRKITAIDLDDNSDPDSPEHPERT